VGDHHRLGALAERQLGLFTGGQAIRCGFDKFAVLRMVTRGTCVHVGKGVYRLCGAPRTWEQRALASVLAAGPRAALSHRAAAALWGVPGFKPNRIEVTKPHGVNRRVGRLWIHGSLWLPDRHATTRGPITVVTPARMLVDIAGQVHPGKLSRAVDNCLALRLATIHDVIKTFEEMARRGRPGIAALRAVLEHRGEGYVAPASELEAAFIEFLEEYALPFPAREVALGDDDAPVGRVEFVYRGARVLVELDGRRNHTALLDREADHLRDLRFTAAGWTVIRITWQMLMTRRDVLAGSLRAALARHTTRNSA
jgi:hypothetical protein